MNRTVRSQPHEGGFQRIGINGTFAPMNIRILIACIAVSACNAAAPANDAANATSLATAAPAAPAKPYADEGSDPLLSWSLSYPADVAAIPALADPIRAEFAKQKVKALADAKEQQSLMAKDGFEMSAYEQNEAYDVVGKTPALLSVQGDWMTFSGGAHPMHGTSAILWDYAAGKKIAIGDLVEGGATAFEKLFAPAYCKALDAERKEKREGEDLNTDASDPFNQCPKFAELSIIPMGSATGGPMTKFLFHADPYVAGPYVEGDYDVELPVTSAFIAALKPAYRASFTAK